jgi:hypothetical protein
MTPENKFELIFDERVDGPFLSDLFKDKVNEKMDIAHEEVEVAAAQIRESKDKVSKSQASSVERSISTTLEPQMVPTPCTTAMRDPLNETDLVRVDVQEIEKTSNPEFRETNSMLTNNLTNNNLESISVTSPELPESKQPVSDLREEILIETK